MGLACSRKRAETVEPQPRVSPFARSCRRSFSRQRVPRAQPAPDSLLALAVDALAAGLLDQSTAGLRRLPADLSQLLLDRLAATERLTDATVRRLHGQQFYELNLDSYPEEVKASWLRCLGTEALEVAVLNKTGVSPGGRLPASDWAARASWRCLCLPGHGPPFTAACLPLAPSLQDR